MSGIDEKPRVEVNPRACEECGHLVWMRTYTECGYARYYVDHDLVQFSGQHDFEWDDGSGWICGNCGVAASREISEHIENRY